MARIIDVIDHTNVMDDEFTYREPQQGSGDWRMGSQVIVGESQAAVFVRGGEALDVLGSGRHTLSTANLPLLSGLIGLATSGRTPFTADLYFVNLKDMPQVGWGTNPPIVLETPGRGLGVVLLITHGVIDIGVDEPMLFVKQYGVGKSVLRLRDLKDRIQSMLLSELAELLTKSGAQSVPEANALLSDVKGAILAQVNEKFAALGLRIKAFEANPFTAKDVPLDELRNYVSLDMWERVQRLQIAQKAAENPGMGGALAGAGVGLGVGQQMGAALNPDAAAMQQQMMQQQLMMQQMMNQMMSNQMGGQQQPPQQANPPANPQTREEIQALLDNLDMKLASGELSEEVYNRLYTKWQERLNQLG
ncbi:MAG: SPFH domain-containing protein [Anaerolineaceae bacterium]|nr:SPFH domain-containing protein [Anaerolineaceae bacterium]